MPRTPRRDLVDCPSTNHCTFRCHNLMPVFEDERMALKFLELLAKYKVTYGILIHAYCLMSTHPHVVLTATLGQQAFSAFWQCVNQALAKYYNKLHGRRGQVVMERLRSPMIEPGGRHLLTVMRYIDLNPVRAGAASSPKDWRFSSYRFYAFGEPNPLIDEIPDYRALGSTAAQRRLAYQHLFAQRIINELLERQPQFTLADFIGSDPWLERRRKVRAGEQFQRFG
ncbi:MAG: transposase [Myxococcales bacterium]|jgi:putative transposase